MLIRIVGLRRRHLEVLRIYIHTLHRLPSAEAYCDRIYAQQQELRESIRLRARADAECASPLTLSSGGVLTSASDDGQSNWLGTALDQLMLDPSVDIYLLLIQVGGCRWTYPTGLSWRGHCHGMDGGVCVREQSLVVSSDTSNRLKRHAREVSMARLRSVRSAGVARSSR